VAEQKVGWGAVFKDGLGLYTIMLNLGIGLHAVDVFIVTTVMPSIVRDIGGASYYSWTTMLYMVASIIGAATGAPLKAKLGARRAYCLGSLLFLFGSVSCAASPSMLILLAARLVQGFGGGLIIALSMALVSELYPERLRKRILSLISSTWGVAALIGPAVGGSFAQISGSMRRSSSASCWLPGSACPSGALRSRPASSPGAAWGCCRWASSASESPATGKRSRSSST
jgi:MFS family permease